MALVATMAQIVGISEASNAQNATRLTSSVPETRGSGFGYGRCEDEGHVSRGIRFRGTESFPGIALRSAAAGVRESRSFGDAPAGSAPYNRDRLARVGNVVVVTANATGAVGVASARLN